MHKYFMSILDDVMHLNEQWQKIRKKSCSYMGTLSIAFNFYGHIKFL